MPINLDTKFDMPPWPHFSEEEVEVVNDVLHSGQVNYWNGQQGRVFEKEFASFCGSKHAIALANGTVALELALYALGIGEGDEVVVTPRSFLASASCVVVRGAVPVFADVDPDSQNITAETIKKVLTPKTKAIIAVHLAGWPCDMDPIMKLAEEHGLKVIEDCAQAHGATYKGRKVGSIGHVGAFSFCTDKIMSTGGEGGMLTTNDDNVWDKAWSYKDHGKKFDTVYNKTHAPGFNWLHESFGTNWRLTEMQSAIGRVQLKLLPKWLETRRLNAAMLNECLSGFSCIRTTMPPGDIQHSYYKLYAFLQTENLNQGWDRDRIMAELAKRGVPGLSGSCSEMYLEKAFDDTDLRPKNGFEVAKELGDTSLMFLVHPTIDQSKMKQMIGVISGVLNEASIISNTN
ncbi:MAG: DegT/DnrJ/EryC1/StrS aminotransferase family protein [Sphingomonadales bacterium]|nr:DegT/DnrJ/EryC1/StrS aminotransferase family protein [Sphingomonadales bacterium]